MTLEEKIDKLIEYDEKILGELQKDVRLLNRIVKGNGDTSKGLIVQVAKLAEKIEAMCKTLNIHWGLLTVSSLGVAAIVIKLLL